MARKILPELFCIFVLLLVIATPVSAQEECSAPSPAECPECPYPGQKLEVHNVKVWIREPAAVWQQLEDDGVQHLPAADVNYLLYSDDSVDTYPDPDIPTITIGSEVLPIVRPGMDMNFNFDEVSVGDTAYTSDHGILIYADAEGTRPYDSHVGEALLSTNSFLQVGDGTIGILTIEAYGGKDCHRKAIVLPVRKDHPYSSFTNVAGNRPYDINIVPFILATPIMSQEWDPETNKWRGLLNQRHVTKVYFVNDDYIFLENCKEPLPGWTKDVGSRTDLFAPTASPDKHWCLRYPVYEKGTVRWGKATATRCCGNPAQVLASSAPPPFDGGGDCEALGYKCCEVEDPDSGCPAVNTYCPVEEGSLFMGATCVENSGPLPFTGSLIGVMCTDWEVHGLTDIHGQTPEFTLNPGEMKWVSHGEFVQDTSVDYPDGKYRPLVDPSPDSKCTLVPPLMDHCSPGYISSMLYPRTNDGKKFASLYSAWAESWGSAHLYFDQCLADAQPFMCVRFVEGSTSGVYIHADKAIYAPGDIGEITVKWKWQQAPFYAATAIPAGSEIDVNVWKVDDETGTRAGLVDEASTVGLVPVDLINDNTVRTASVFFMNNTGGFLSNFEVEVKMVPPPGITESIGHTVFTSQGCGAPSITEPFDLTSVQFSIGQEAPAEYECTKEVIFTDIGGRIGEAAKFTCEVTSEVNAKPYYFIQDFRVGYPSANVADNLAAWLESFYAVASDDLSFKDADEHAVLGMSNPLSVSPQRMYVSELAPDICAVGVLGVPKAWPAGIGAEIMPGFANCGFLNIGAEEVDGVEYFSPGFDVKMDYGDGKAPDLFGPYSLLVNIATLVVAAHTFDAVGRYDVNAFADPSASPELIFEGNEENNELLAEFVARPACSRAFCTDSFTEEAADTGDCAPCESAPGVPGVPGYEYVPGGPCTIAANFICFSGSTSPAVGGSCNSGAGSALVGCPACGVQCVDDLDCESGLLCDGGMCVLEGQASEGPIATMSADVETGPGLDRAFTYVCRDPERTNACIGGSAPGCVSSCTLDVDTATPASDAEFGGAAPGSGDATVGGGCAGDPDCQPVGGCAGAVCSCDAGACTYTHTYPATGAYTAKLTVENCYGVRDEEIVNIFIGNNNPPVANIITPADFEPVTAGDAIMLSGEGVDVEDGYSLSYWWLVDGLGVDDDMLDPADGTTTFNYLGSGSLGGGPHEVKLVVTDQGWAGPPAELPATGEDAVTIIITGGEVYIAELEKAGVHYMFVTPEDGGEFKADIWNLNSAPVDVDVELRVDEIGECVDAGTCPVPATCNRALLSLPGSGWDQVVCEFGPGKAGDIAFATGKQYRYTVQISVTCGAGVCDTPYGNTQSKPFVVANVQAVAVPEIPVVLVVLVALAVLALLRRSRR